MELTDLLAREAIRDLVARYNSYGDSGLFDRMLELFAPDAVLEIRDIPHHGHDAIRAVFTRVPGRTAGRDSPGQRDRPAYLRHCTSTHQIDLLDATTATGRSYFFVLTTVGLDHWGRYLDEYRVVDGEWRFARRRVLPDTVSPQSLFSQPDGE
jgi:hypothetical protein